jgi:hypothetical protein
MFALHLTCDSVFELTATVVLGAGESRGCN